MTKILTAILVGHAIATPLAFWLAKKVHAKAMVHLFQIFIVLGLCSSIFFYFLQTRLAWLVVSFSVLISLTLFSVELLLKRVVAKNVSDSSKKSYLRKGGTIGHQTTFEQARIDSGCYPFDYLDPIFWSETQALIQETQIKRNAKLGQLSLFEKFQNFNFAGNDLKVSGGIRCTTGKETDDATLRIFVFGGSTIFCHEVPDSLTVSSFLQRMSNSVFKASEVLNLGWSGATVMDRFKALQSLENLNRNDIVMVYFGVNDAGHTFVDQEGKNLKAEDMLPLYLRILNIIAKVFDLEIAKWVYQETSPRRLTYIVDHPINQTIVALTAFEKYCHANELQLIVILQPNLFTMQTKHSREVQIEKSFPYNLKAIILYAYGHFEKWVKETPYAVSATHIFDNAPAPVFLDWAHVNARGNEIVAKFIFEELQRRGMLSSDSKL